jgi:hypothetical protein
MNSPMNQIPRLSQPLSMLIAEAAYAVIAGVGRAASLFRRGA